MEIRRATRSGIAAIRDIDTAAGRSPAGAAVLAAAIFNENRLAVVACAEGTIAGWGKSTDTGTNGLDLGTRRFGLVRRQRSQPRIAPASPVARGCCCRLFCRCEEQLLSVTANNFLIAHSPR